jgi:hypothetical protein
MVLQEAEHAAADPEQLECEGPQALDRSSHSMREYFVSEIASCSSNLVWLSSTAQQAIVNFLLE